MRTTRHPVAIALALAFTVVMISVPAFAATSVDVTVSADKASYFPGEIANVNALATYDTGEYVAATKSKTITIKDSGGATLVNAATMTYSSNGNYTYDYPLASDAPVGTWTVTCVIKDKQNIQGTGMGSFAVAAGGGTSSHSDLLWSDYPSNCRVCHAPEFSAMYGALHYQWQSPAPDNTNKTGTMQGKATNAMNAYCINILGNWTTCGKCHPGRGAMPVLTDNPTTAQLDNIDCLVCHNEAYQMARVRLADGTMGPAASTSQAKLDGFVRNVGKPVRANCLKCHAYAGGGDAVKRGDISMVQSNTADGNLDVHMATTRGNLKCQACHAFVNHKVTGKGSDLESTDNASEVKCATPSCHPTRVSGGHATTSVNKHIAHVACQTCHIPVYGKVATEVERDWRNSLVNGTGWKPTEVKGSNVTPTYQWWNRKTSNYLKGDAAVYDATTGTYHMEVLQGGVTGDTTNKIYPFKYKVAYQPIRTTGSLLVALDTNEYLNLSGNYGAAVQKGLSNMGFATTDAYSTAKTDTYQLLNHTVADAQSTGGTLTCANCHEAAVGGAGTKLALKTMGYSKKADYSVLCTQCHSQKTWKGYVAGHSRHVDGVGADCSYCHSFSRPERALTMP